MTHPTEIRGHQVLVRWQEAVPPAGKPKRLCVLLQSSADTPCIAVYQPTGDEELELCSSADAFLGMQLLHRALQSSRAVLRAAELERREWVRVHHPEDFDAGELQALDEASRGFRTLFSNFTGRYGHVGTKTEDLTR